MIADRNKVCDRLRSSAIVWKHTSAIVCDPAITIADDRRRSQKIEHKGWFPYDRRSQIADRNKVCDRLRLYGNILLQHKNCVSLSNLKPIDGFGPDDDSLHDKQKK